MAGMPTIAIPTTKPTINREEYDDHSHIHKKYNGKEIQKKIFLFLYSLQTESISALLEE